MTDEDNWNSSRKEIIKQAGFLGYLRLHSLYKSELPYSLSIKRIRTAFERLDLGLRIIFLEGIKYKIYHDVLGDERRSCLDTDTLVGIVEKSKNQDLRYYAIRAQLHRKISGEEKKISLTREEKLLLLTDYDFQREYSYNLRGIRDGMKNWQQDDPFKSFRLMAYQQIKPTLTYKEIDKIIERNRDKEILLDLLDPRTPKPALVQATYNPYFEVDEKAFDLLEDILIPEDVGSLTGKPIRLINRIIGHPQAPRDILLLYATKGYLDAFERIERTLDADELEEISKKCWMYTPGMEAIRERIILHESSAPKTIARIFASDLRFTTEEVIGYKIEEMEDYLGRVIPYEVPIAQRVYTNDDIERAYNLIKNRDEKYKKEIIFEIKKLEKESKMAEGLENILK